MARRNLPQASLLDISGELGPKAQQQLHTHLQNSPSAQQEYNTLKTQMALLKSLPKPNLTEAQKSQISTQIKQSLHQSLRRQQQQAAKQRRWRLASPALAGALALAACLAIAFSVGHLLNTADLNRKAAVAKAEQSLRDYIDSDTPNLTDVAYHDVDDQIKAEEDEPRILSAEVSVNAMQQLVDDLDHNHHPNPQPPERGSL